MFETYVLAGFVLARASAGLADGTIRGDVGHLDQMRAWLAPDSYLCPQGKSNRRVATG